MKKILISILLTLSVVVLAACTHNSKKEDTQSTAVTHTQTQKEDSKQDQQNQDETESSEIKKIEFRRETKDTQQTTETSLQTSSIGIDVYKKALSNFLNQKMLPDQTPFTEENLDSSVDVKFAIYDVDGDGEKELILQIDPKVTAGMTEMVYGYDTKQKSFYQEITEFPFITYYNNGVLLAKWSHNQGVAGDNFWPYTLYQYNKATKVYDEIGSVDGWDKSYTSKDYNGNAFPDKTDINQDGMLYFLMPQGSTDESNPVDNQAYEDWRKQYVDDQQKIDLTYTTLNQKEIDALSF